jgi:DNA-directed RNA polymerase specialized sigma24 family protein
MAKRKRFTREELIDRIRKQKAEVAQFLQDLESYNENNPDGAFIDPARYDMEAVNADLDRLLASLTR